MRHIRRLNPVSRKRAGGRQTQEDIPPTTPSNSSTSPASQQPTEQSLGDEASDALAKKMPDLVEEYDELLAKKEQMANSAPSETTSSQLPVPRQRRAAPEAAERERLLAKQRKRLQLSGIARNGNGAMYELYKDRVELRVEGTCRWFLEHDNFQQWLSQESGPLLVSADPGCGKSVLAKYLIDHELAKLSATICYFFFKDQDQNTTRQALGALLYQLFSQKSALIQHAMPLYNKRDATLVQSDTLLWTILRDALRDPQAGPVIFVIDALDQCDESQLSSLIKNLENMFHDQQLANAKFKVLMTSRPYEQVVSKVYRSLQDSFPRIHIPGEEEFEAIGQEVNSVIHHRVEQLAKKHWLSDRIKSSLNSKLLAIDHRTYLWVYLVFDYLDNWFNTGSEKTEAGIDAAMHTLPTSVNQAYDQILRRSQNDETVKKALSIILAARRPLTLSEMNIAMNLDGPGRGRSIYDLDPEQDSAFKIRLRRLCSLFVNVDHEKIYFLHQTAREFLIQSSAPTTVSSDMKWHHSISTRHAHSVLAEVCMLYLDRLNSTPSETFRQDDQHGALLQYSVEHWGDHFREAEFEEGSAMVDLALELCTPDLTSHSFWASIISMRYHIRPDTPTNVLIASHLGLTPVTELLLRNGADIEEKDSQGRTALMLAAGSDHEAVARLLLKNSAKIEAKDDRSWTGLMHAARYGHEAVARLLLKNGTDVEARDNGGRTALMLSAESGHEAVARLLLDRGADVLATNADGRTAMMLAAKFGHEAVTRLLLENGADVEARDNGGRTALMLAAEHGHEAVTRLLLGNGSDVEARDDGDWTALIVAAHFGHEAVIRLLLEFGADIEATDNDGWTALMHAARSGLEAVTRLLLGKGANIEAMDDDGCTALMHCARYGHEAVTRLLLEWGADVLARNADGRSALICAARSNHEVVSRLLLEKGADVEARDGDGWTALLHAATYGHEAVTWLLLDNGADIEARDDDGWTALMQAARSSHEAVTRLLLDNGAGIEAIDNDGWTALMHASSATTHLLLHNGDEVEASDVER